MTEHAAYVFDLDGVVRDFAPGVPTELALLGLDRLFDGVLNSADFGVAKPDLQAYAAAHRAIEADLGRAVAGAEVWFTDDRSRQRRGRP